MDSFDPAAAEAAAKAADSGTPPPSPGAPAATSNPAGMTGAPAPGAPAPAPSKPAAVPHLTAEVAVEFIDQGLYMALKRKAKKLGLKIGPADREVLKLTEVEKDELLLFAPGVMPYIAQYADLLGKASLALFGFALWSIYKDKSDTLELAARIAAENAKQGPGFAAGKPANGGVVLPVPPPLGPRGPAAPSAPEGPFDPDKVKGIPVHEPRP